jgi:hypothetical protein
MTTVDRSTVVLDVMISKIALVVPGTETVCACAVSRAAEGMKLS